MNCEGEVRLRKPKIRWLARQVLAAVQAQFQLSRHNIEDVMPIFTVPLLTLVSMAILVQSGRQDLAGYALVASLLMNIGQMGFFVGSEIIVLDRRSETLELIVASPASYVIVLATRILVLTSVGLIGFLAKHERIDFECGNLSVIDDLRQLPGVATVTSLPQAGAFRVDLHASSH